MSFLEGFSPTFSGATGGDVSGATSNTVGADTPFSVGSVAFGPKNGGADNETFAWISGLVVVVVLFLILAFLRR